MVGRPFRSDKLAHTLLPKRIALPVFASDALSSVAYAPQEIFATLSVAGLAAYSFAPWIAILVCLVMLVVVASYRQNVHAYPSGGGDYEVATTNLGPKFGLTVASALLVDYNLDRGRVHGVGRGQHRFGHSDRREPPGHLVGRDHRGDHRPEPAWIRESGTAFAIPVYAFMVSILCMIVFGLFQAATGNLPEAESAHFTLVAEHSLTGFALIFLVARGFSSGSAAADRCRGDAPTACRPSASRSRRTRRPRWPSWVAWRSPWCSDWCSSPF